MKKTIIICYIVTTIIQFGFAQISTIEVTQLLKNNFLHKSLFEEGITYKKEGKLYFLEGYPIQRSLPSFGYVSTTFSSQNHSYSFTGKENTLDISIEQQLDSIKLFSSSYGLVQRNEKIFIASGPSFKSCADSLFQKKKYLPLMIL